MADRRETFAGSLSGVQLRKTTTVPNTEGDRVKGVLRALLHQRPGAVGLFLEDRDRPEMVSGDAIAVVPGAAQEGRGFDFDKGGWQSPDTARPYLRRLQG
jgi:hypothetical protein